MIGLISLFFLFPFVSSLSYAVHTIKDVKKELDKLPEKTCITFSAEKLNEDILLLKFEGVPCERGEKE